jgi:hypothetical protein
MGVGSSTGIIEGFGFTVNEALTSLNAQLAFKYNTNLKLDKDLQRHVVFSGTTPRYVELYKAPHSWRVLPGCYM